MGILNVTPDSFSDGGKFFDAGEAVKRGIEIIEQGAEIIDIGAMSTRPGSEAVEYTEEIRRLGSVLEKIREYSGSIIISVDTVNPETALFAVKNGADIINDVSGYFNESTAEIIKEYGCGWIVTHTGNVPAQTVLKYSGGVVKSVNDFFDEITKKCIEFGISKESLCLDPGFGFAKTADDNMELLKNLDETVRGDIAHITGLSRKRFIGELTGEKNPEDRVIGTAAADLIALMKGTDIIRVHDVKEAAQSLNIYNSIYKEKING